MARSYFEWMESVPVVVTLTIRLVEKLPSHSISAGSVICVQWKRPMAAVKSMGKKKSKDEPLTAKSGDFPQVPYQYGVAEWPDDDSASAQLVCTMQRQPGAKTFKRKKISFQIICFHPYLPHKDRRTLGKAVLDLGELITPSGQCTLSRQVPVQNRYNAGVLHLHIRAEPASSASNKSSGIPQPKLKAKGFLGRASRHNLFKEPEQDPDEMTDNGSDDLATDLGEVDGGYVDRVVTKAAPVDEKRLTVAARKPSSNEASLKKELEVIEWRKMELERQIRHVTNSKQTNDALVDQLCFGHQDNDEAAVPEEGGKTLSELEKEVIALEETKQQQNLAIEKLLQSIRAEESLVEANMAMEEELKSKLFQQENQPAGKRALENALLAELNLEDLKEQNHQLTTTLKEYQETLQQLEGPQNPANILGKQLQLLKNAMLSYRTEYEEYTAQGRELAARKEEIQDRLEDIAQGANTESHHVDPEQYRARVHFLRKQFLCEFEAYDPITREPAATLAIIQFIEENDCEEGWLMEILLMLRFMAVNARRDFQRLCYLLSTALCLTNYLESSPRFGYSGDVQGFGVQDDVTETGSATEELTVQQKVNLLNFELYLLLCQQVFPLLDQQLEVSFLSDHALILDKSSKMMDPSRLAGGLTKQLNSVLRQLNDASIYPVVVKQIFHQIVFYISAKLANKLLETPNLCTSTFAMRIKMGLSFLNGWIQEASAKGSNVLADCEDHLTIILDVVGVLLTATGSQEPFQTIESVEERFSMLNLLQVQMLLNAYQPDGNAPDPVPSGIKKAVERLLDQLTAKERSRLVKEFPYHLNLSQFNPLAELGNSSEEERGLADKEEQFDISDEEESDDGLHLSEDE